MAGKPKAQLQRGLVAFSLASPFPPFWRIAISIWFTKEDKDQFCLGFYWKMGWPYQDLSLEGLLKLIKGFVDMLILASGYQSSGHLAHWDSQNIKNAFQWALVLEKGLTQMTSLSLCGARDLILKHLIHALPLGDAHLRAILSASIEMDLDELLSTGNDRLHVYVEKLTLQSTSLNPILDRIFLMEDTKVSPRDILPNNKPKNYIDGDFTMCSIQEIVRRQFIVSCMSSAQKGLDILSKAMTQSKLTNAGSSFNGEQLGHAVAPMTEERLIEPVIWNRWRTRSLSYLLDKRTVRLVSGASMIFSAPKVQWVQVLEQLDTSVETSDGNLSDKTELLLLGCTASRWNSVIEHFMSTSYDCLTISKQYHEVRNLLHGRSQNLHSREEMDFKERGALEYLEVLLGSQIHLLWKVSPTLASIAIPSWSQLFKLYLGELNSQFKGDCSQMSCFPDGKEHKDCEFAERIWCLYIFHVHDSHRRDATNIV